MRDVIYGQTLLIIVKRKDWIPGVWDAAVHVVNEVKVEVVDLTEDLVLEGLHLAGLLDQDDLFGRVPVDADAWKTKPIIFGVALPHSDSFINCFVFYPRVIHTTSFWWNIGFKPRTRSWNHLPLSRPWLCFPKQSKVLNDEKAQGINFQVENFYLDWEPAFG